jgi:ComF family protein
VALADPPVVVPRPARRHAALWNGRLRRPLAGPVSLPLRILCPACCATLVAPCEVGALPATGIPVVAAFAPAPALFELIHALKYEAKTELVPHLAACMARAARRVLGPDLCLVPVPLHATRLRARGFNQSALLAHGVAARLGTPVLEHVLARTRATTPQARLPAAARAANVADAFQRRGRLPAGGSRWVLVDDVVTTGATAAAAFAALGVGLESAAVLTLCHARPEPAR